jgi:hypothetical protein
VGSNEKITLPAAIEPVKKVKNFMAKTPILNLKIPIKHIKPIPRLRPPYKPAISEYPISDEILSPTASKKEGIPVSNAPRRGSNIAHTPISK